jgi:hypothetical protein
MEEINWTLVILCYAICATFLVAYFWLSRIYKNRKPKDKTPVPQHKSLFRSPTWRFQKFHPNNCPHHNGIYREVEIKVLDKTFKKTIFVCADCVDAIDIDEIKERDKFKAN